MSVFIEKLKAAFAESQHALCLENRKTDAHYQHLQKEYKRLYESIREKLGEDEKTLFAFEAATNEMDGIDNDLIYLQGMIDSAEWMKMLKLIG